jgi:hypothetical protein
MKPNRLILTLCLAIVALPLAIWLVTSVHGLYDRIAEQSRPLAIGLVGLIVAVLSALGVVLTRLLWRLSRSETAHAPVRAPTDLIKAARAQADEAKRLTETIEDVSARQRIKEELDELERDGQARRFHVVVFGTGSSGKTSLINALLGQTVGRTEAVMGTTRRGEAHTQVIQGVEGTLLLTDTPGLAEIGEGGLLREAEARDLAARADLILFVVDHDLIRSEFEPLAALARQGKRSILVLNKQDRLVDADREAILDKLRERLDGLLAPADIIAVAADPRPMPVRLRRPDGTTETVVEAQPPDLSSLHQRIRAILAKEGDHLRAANLLLRAHQIGQAARDELSQQRQAKARSVVDRYQWITAAAVFSNPLPAVDLLASSAVQLQMISELSQIYGVELSLSHVRTLFGQVAQTLLKLGIVEAASSLIAGLFKSTFVGYAAGGAVQAVTMAYLTHISGHAFAEYFARGQDWGDGGMQAALERQFQLNSRAEFLKEFARQALEKVTHKVKGTEPAASREPSA